MTYQQTAWSLADLFPGLGSPELEAAFQTLETQVADFEKVRPELGAGMDVERFMEIIQLSEQGTRLARKLYEFAELAFAADTQDQAVQTLMARIQQFLAELENRTLFFSLWWKDLDDAERQTPDGRVRRLPLLPRRDASLQAAHPQRGGRKGHQPEERDRRQCIDHPLRLRITNRYTFKLEVDGETSRN